MSVAHTPVGPAAPAAAADAAAGRAPVHPLRRRLQWTCLAVLIADLALVGWLISPQAPSIGAAQQQLYTTRADLARLQRQARDLELLQGRVHLSREQMQELTAEGMPEDAEADNKLLAEINRLGVEADASVAQVGFKRDTKSANGLLGIAMDMQVAGDYAQVMHFINGMERSPMFFIINQVSVTSGQRGEAEVGAAAAPPLKLDVKVTAYVRTSSGEPTATTGVTP